MPVKYVPPKVDTRKLTGWQYVIVIALLVGAAIAAALLAGCGTTVNGQKGVDLKEAQGYVNLFPACPTLPAGDPAAQKEIVMAWLTTLKDIAGALPAGLTVTVNNVIERNVSGTLQATSDLEAQIQASVSDAFKDFIRSPGAP